MPPHQDTLVKSTVVPFEPAALPARLKRLGHHDVLERWCAVDRSAHDPHIVAVVGDDGEDWAAAALVTARPHTAYLKIVDAVGDVPAAVEAVVAHARNRELEQVKWEGWTVTPEAAATAGFAPLSPPLTHAEGASGPGTGHVRWLHDDATRTRPPSDPHGGVRQNPTVASLEGLTELEASMAALSTPMRVYVEAGRFTEPDPDLPELAARIRGLLAAVAADESWQRFLPGYTPPSAQEICAALEPLETHDVAPFLARLAAVDLVWPSHRHLPAEAAEHAADRVVSLLGPEASWWTNHDVDCGAVNGLTPLFDSLLAGTNGEHFALALQIADD